MMITSNRLKKKKSKTQWMDFWMDKLCKVSTSEKQSPKAVLNLDRVKVKKENIKHLIFFYKETFF